MSKVDRVLGGFEVDTKLGFGSEHLLLVFTDLRLLFVRVAKIGRESMAFSNVLGGLARGLGRAKKKRSLLEMVAELDPGAILKMDRQNFAISYEDVVSFHVGRGSRDVSELVLVTRDSKIVMSAAVAVVEGLRDVMMERLEGKLEFQL